METDCQGCAAALPLLREAARVLPRPVLIGIGGPGGSGKSSFAAKLADHLDDARIILLDYPRFSAGMADEAHLILWRTRCGRLVTQGGPP